MNARQIFIYLRENNITRLDFAAAIARETVSGASGDASEILYDYYFYGATIEGYSQAPLEELLEEYSNIGITIEELDHIIF